MRRTGNCSALPAIGMYVSGTSNGVRIGIGVVAAVACVATPPAAIAAAAWRSSRRLLVGMLPPRFGDDIQHRRRRASRTEGGFVADRKMPGDDGVERSIILLVLLAIAERKLARRALGKRYARRAPGAGIGQLVHLVAIDRAQLAVRIPRAR